MNFRITGLAPEPFFPLFGLTDEALAARGAKRYITQAGSALPDRVEMRDAQAGESVILVNHEHQPADTPYRSRHAIFVLEGATTAYDRVGDIPDVLATRPLSLRAFDAAHMMIDADLGDGRKLEGAIERLFGNPDVAYIHAHYATRGCYAGRIDRA